MAGPIGGTFQAWLVAPALGQSAPAEQISQDTRQQTADLLRRARQAMAENDLAAADSLISQAEALGVQYNPLYMGDTPKKARHDLDRKRNVSAATPSKPSKFVRTAGVRQEQGNADDRPVRRPARRFARRCRRRRASRPAAASRRPQPDPSASGRWRWADAAAFGADLSNHGAG